MFYIVLLSLIAITLAAPIPSDINCVNGETIVSGLSSGAFMAEQYHIAFSSHLSGAGIIAGGPFYCAQAQIDKALVDCTNMPDNIDISILENAADYCAKQNVCDDLSNLKNTRAWLFSGQDDSVVKPGVMNKLLQFLQNYMPASNINSTFSVPAEHSWPTTNYGNQCSYLGSPYINDCSFDAASDMISFISNYQLNASVPAVSANLITFDQQPYTPNQADPSTLSMGPQAYLYAPQVCRSNNSNCRLVIAFHGCQQTLADITTDFVQHIGLNEVAEANNLVVLYPQAIKSYYPISNPEGCWDWWGYTDSNYANQKGVQMTTIFNMVQAITHSS